MVPSSRANDEADDAALLSLFNAIVSQESLEVARLLDATPGLAGQAIRVGASRQEAQPYFLEPIGHYVYAGDTGLHIAAAAYQRSVARSLLSKGASSRARNRRGAEPLHYAAEGLPGSASWDPAAQRDVIDYLIETGADPNAFDDSGVAALHRAVRTRCSAAVRALLANGADPLLTNKRGSTPLHLAVQNTGRGETGTAAARQEQRQIIVSLLEYGARPTDTDATGKTAEESAVSDWVREFLNTG
jgi:ankyrin repeat protein